MSELTTATRTPAVPASVCFAAAPRIERPEIRIPSRERREARDVQLDLEKLMAAAVIEQALFFLAIREDLLSFAAEAFRRGQQDLPAPRQDATLRAHAERIARLFAAARALGAVQVRRAADLPLGRQSHASMQFAELGAVAPGRAVEYLRRLSPMTRAQWEAAIESARQRAFTVAGVEQQTVLRELRDLVARSLEEGLTPGQFDRAAGEVLRNYQVSAHRMRTIWNTNIGNALARGREEELRNPEVAAVLTHRLYDAMLDQFTRPNHAALEGAIAASAWWDGPGAEFKPLRGYNCRCALLGLTRARAERLLETGGKYFDIAAQGVPDDAFPAREF